MSDNIARRTVCKEAHFVAFALTASTAVGVACPVAVIVGSISHDWLPSASLGLIEAAVVVAAFHLFASLVFPAPRRAVASGLLALAIASVFVLTTSGNVSVTAALAIAGAAQISAARTTARLLSPGLHGVFGRRPIVATLWVMLGILLVVQSARLSTYMGDPAFDWWLTTRDALWAKHMCMPAYVEAADLQRQGVENIYANEHYPVMARTAAPAITVRNMEAFVGDPFQYPPQFLLLPRLWLALTNDFLAMRTVWYGLQLVAFLLVAFALAAWVGGNRGWVMAMLVPALWLSVPAIQGMQYGQFHLVAILLAVAGMLAFERKRSRLGGALLSAAIVGKIFPGVLLVLLLAQRRWRDAAWTLAFVGIITLAALAVVGVQPFHAFITYQLPRLAGGQAFDFAKEWPEFRISLAVLDNLSPSALVVKLREFGIANVGPWADQFVRWGFRAVLVAVLVVTSAAFIRARAQDSGGARDASRDRAGRAAVWLALLNLAALEGAGAWGDYITFGSVWLLTLLATDMGSGSIGRMLLLATCWLFFVLVPGAQPWPFAVPLPVALSLAIACTGLLVVFNAWVAVLSSRSLSQRVPQAVEPGVSA